jgi:hypothetical protein
MSAFFLRRRIYRHCAQQTRHCDRYNTVSIPHGALPKETRFWLVLFFSIIASPDAEHGQSTSHPAIALDRLSAASHGRCRAAEQRYELASLQPFEMHLLPVAGEQDSGLTSTSQGIAAVQDFDASHVSNESGPTKTDGRSRAQ